MTTPDRLDIAKHALAGFLANPSPEFHQAAPAKLAVWCVEMADALIAELAKPAAGAELPGIPAAPKKAKTPELSDADWMASLAKSPAYKGLDVHVQFSKMTFWCETNGKLPSRKRFVNWLNRSEKPLAAPQHAQDEPVDAPPCPDWKARADRLRNREHRYSWATHARTDIHLAADLAADLEENP